MKSLISFLFKAWLNFPLLLITACVFLVLTFLYSEADAFVVMLSKSPGKVFLSAEWFPSEGKFGLVALVVATVAILLLAIFLSAAIAVACAFATVIYVHKRLKGPIITFFECAGSLPPVIIGLCGLTVLVPFFARFFAPGFGVLSSALVLAVLLIPSMSCHWVTVIQREHDETHLLARSLGIGSSSLIANVLWPALKPLFLRSLVLYTQRGMAETLAIVMVAGNVVRVPLGLFEPLRTINSTIALEIPYAEGIHRSALFFLSLTVFGIALSLSISAHATRTLRTLLQAKASTTTGTA